MAGSARRVVVLVVLAGLVALAGETAHAACADRAGGARGDTLVVGFSAAPPFVVATSIDHEVGGFAIDMLRALAAHEGWRLELVELTPETLRARLAACALDVGVVGVALSAALIAPGSASEPMLELSLPYFSTVTTVLVNGEDDARAVPAALGRGGSVGYAFLRGLACGLASVAALALASWLLNAFAGVPGRRALRWRRIDAAVNGPWAGLRWLTRSTTGRVLTLVWLVIGIALGVTGAIDGAPSPLLGDEALGTLVERASRAEGLVGERYPDGAVVSCAEGEARACFHGFATGTLAAIAGPREILCMHAAAFSLDDAILRRDLDIPEQFAYLLPPASPLRARLNLALLRHHERAGVQAPLVRCPGAGAGS
jgi:ABC-type amino acid transport substrate-binding protein